MSDFDKRRIEMANSEFEAYDFGDSTVTAVDGWDYTTPGTEFTRTVWFENKDDPDGDDIKGHFTVTFDGTVGFTISDANASIDGNDIGKRGPTGIVHPIPVGTILKAAKQHMDSGVMTWDDTDTEIERVAEPGSICHVWDVEPGVNGYRYQVTFEPSQVWNVLDEADFTYHPGDYEVVALGQGVHSNAYNAFMNSKERDPEAVRKIEEQLNAEGPSL